MTDKPKAPDPAGPMPDDWNPKHWLAYVEWAVGKGNKAAAQAGGCSTGHITRLARGWRDTFDVSDLSPRLPGKMTPEIQAKGAAANMHASRLRWMARQADIADSVGEDLVELRLLVRQVIDRYRQPDMLPLITIADLRHLVWMMVQLQKVANVAAQNEDPGPIPGSTPEVPEVEAGLLDDLFGSGGTSQEVLDDIELLAKGFLAEIAPGEIYDHVVEVHEVDVSR